MRNVFSRRDFLKASAPLCWPLLPLVSSPAVMGAVNSWQKTKRFWEILRFKFRVHRREELM